MKKVIEHYGPQKSILGVCLGLQGIGEVYGAKLFNIPKVLHGVTSFTEVKDPEEYLFKGVSPRFQATHYHSWAVVPETVNGDLQITAVNDENLVMGLRHKIFDVRGVQFHPESVLSPEGGRLLDNLLQQAS